MSGYCKDCIFFQHEEITTRCRRYPPAGVGGMAEGVFPFVKPMHWCGEFKPRPEGFEEKKFG